MYTYMYVCGHMSTYKYIFKLPDKQEILQLEIITYFYAYLKQWEKLQQIPMARYFAVPWDFASQSYQYLQEID